MPDEPKEEMASRSAGAPGLLRRIFIGPAGLRGGWGFVLFVGLLFLETVAIGFVWDRYLDPPPDVPWDPVWTTVGEAFSLGAVLLAIAVMSRLERRSLAEYGLVLRRLFGRRFWEGVLWGLAMVAGVVVPLWAVGGYSVRGLHVEGSPLVSQSLLWALAFLLIGLREEALFRTYPLNALARGMGFWPAAVALSALFGALHYFLKPDETWIDGVSTGLIALFLCLTVRRTGDIGLAVGIHFAFNYAALFVFGGPNTGNAGQPIPGRLLDASLEGPQWLTGGPMGFEASAFIFLVLAIAFPLFHRLHPDVRFTPRPRPQVGSNRGSPTPRCTRGSRSAPRPSARSPSTRTATTTPWDRATT